MNIQWYPGHMAKTKRIIKENIKLVDVVVELLDARIPRSSKNPDIDELAANKKRIVVLNKADLSDDKSNLMWKEYYETLGFKAVLCALHKDKNINEIENAARFLTREKAERLKAKGVLHMPVRLMILGIPNVGKSTLINKYIGKAITKTADRPGVTRGVQWIRVKKDFELLDTPGVLWPKFDDPTAGLHLAYTGAINDQIMDVITLARSFGADILRLYPDALNERYGAGINFAEDNDINNGDVLEKIGKARGFLKRGGEIDIERTAVMLIDEFRAGKLGRICLERTNED